jgi:hypothetical protein
LSPHAVGSLNCIPTIKGNPFRYTWQLVVKVDVNGVEVSMTIEAIGRMYIYSLLMRCPTLCFGASDELLLSHAQDNDLESLFVRPRYRTVKRQ